MAALYICTIFCLNGTVNVSQFLIRLVNCIAGGFSISILLLPFLQFYPDRY